MQVQCELLGLSRSSVYYTPRQPDEHELLVKRRIDEIYTASPFYGIRRITAQLRADGLAVNHKAVAWHMQEMGLRAICPGPNLSKRKHAEAVYPYLLRGLDITCPNQVWGVDITYIRQHKGWMYLFAVLDWYSRYVVSFALDTTLDIGFVQSPCSTRWRPPRPLSATPTRAATLPVRSISTRYALLRCKSAWTARGALSTTSSPSGFGVRSNMRRST